MQLTRRSVIAMAAALPAVPALAERLSAAAGQSLSAERSPAAGHPLAATAGRSFPKDFLWGAATAGHQVEGNNINADLWLLENIRPTLYAERSGDALNSFELWQQDLDLVAQIGLNSYRFSLEWARIEPDAGQFSIAMLDHYKRMIDACRDRGITPVVTFNHYTTPTWFAKQGGWTHPDSPRLFTRFCERAARHLGANIGWATTLNEPNVMRVLAVSQRAERVEQQREMLEAAAKAAGVAKYVAGNAANPEDLDVVTRNQIAGHKSGRAAIKAVRPDLPVGVSLAMLDEQAAAGGEMRRDQMREGLYGAWLDAVRGDDFLGVQNYERRIWGADGTIPPAPGVEKNTFGHEVYPPSLAGAVRYAYQVTGIPIVVTEHGVGTDDDSIRARMIPAALSELRKAMDDGVPIRGYIHWSLLDNFEWSHGYGPKFGLGSVDRTTFQRTLKPSARVLCDFARRNAL